MFSRGKRQENFESMKYKIRNFLQIELVKWFDPLNFCQLFTSAKPGKGGLAGLSSAFSSAIIRVIA